MIGRLGLRSQDPGFLEVHALHIYLSSCDSCLGSTTLNAMLAQYLHDAGYIASVLLQQHASWLSDRRSIQPLHFVMLWCRASCDSMPLTKGAAHACGSQESTVSKEWVPRSTAATLTGCQHSGQQGHNTCAIALICCISMVLPHIWGTASSSTRCTIVHFLFTILHYDTS